MQGSVKYQKGFSLVEALLAMAFLSLIIIPFILLFNQTTQISKGVYAQSTRSLILSSSPDQMDATRIDYYDAVNDTTINTSISDSGQVLPFMTVEDTTNSNNFNKTAYFYAYPNNSTVVTSPLNKL